METMRIKPETFSGLRRHKTAGLKIVVVRVRESLVLCPRNMKPNLHGLLHVLRRPIALMLALLPAGALVFSYAMVQWSEHMTANGRITNPDLAMVLEGFG